MLGSGLTTLATTGSGAGDAPTSMTSIDDGTLPRPTVWLFGSEAHGLPEHGARRGADRPVRVPIHGRAESLNLAAAAAVCLYASARAQRR